MTGSHPLFVVPISLLLAATAGPPAVAAPCDPAYVKAHHKVVTVLPSDGDDTANLQCAIDRATTLGRGAIVQLLPGTYTTQQLLVTALRGTIRGAGRKRTLLKNPDFPVPIDNPVPWEVGPPAPENRYPVLLSVIGGEVVLSDLSIRIVGTNVTGDWYWGTFGPLNFFVPALFVYGSHTALHAERIGISGGSACFPEPEANLLVAIEFHNYASSLLPWVSNSELSVEDSVFTGGCGAVYGSQLSDSAVTVTRSTLTTPLYGLMVGDLFRTRVEFSHNRVSVDPATPMAGAVVFAGDFGTGTTDSALLFRNNSFAGARGVSLQENGLTPAVGDPIFFGDINCAMFGNDVDDTTTGYLLQGGTRDCAIVVRRHDTVVDETNGAHTIIRRGR